MALEIIKAGLPDELKTQLMVGENVYYFSYISSNGGCLSSSSRDEHWIALTDKKVVYNTKVIEDQKTVEKNGILPLAKISFVEVTDEKSRSGCTGCISTQSYNLIISTSGGAVNIPIPTKEKGFEIRKVYSEIIEAIGHEKPSKI